MEWLQNQGIKNDPMGSLKVSMDVSISMLQPDKLQLFYLIGLLPGGCTNKQLDELWEKDALRIVTDLLTSSLLVKKQLGEEDVY